MTQFEELYKRFKQGLAWINEGYVKRGWVRGKHGLDPAFERDIKEFETSVVEPMEAEWRKFTIEEKRSYETKRL